MPTLNWIGKEAVAKHHKEVPYRLLEAVPELSCGSADSGNLIVQGDNLHALKALLPRYAGQVKCIYIDPPYNTGNEGWAYNDNVNSPEIRRWLGEVVGKEGETLDRHDRWLCMMYPRLVLLRQLLREDGVLFCSIGRDEIGNLRLLLDEVFGHNCLIETFIFVTEGNTENAEDVTAVHDYVLAYARTADAPVINPTIDPAVGENSKLLRDFAENSVVKNGKANPASEVELPIGFPCEVEHLDLPAFSDSAELMRAVEENGGWIAREFRDRFSVSYPVRLDRLLVVNGRLVSPCRVYSGWSSADKLRRYIASNCQPIEVDVYDKLDSHLSLFGIEEGWDVLELVGWLDRNIAFPYADRDQKVAWINAVVQWLVTQRKPAFTVAELAYRKFRLRAAVERKLAAGLTEAKQGEFDQLLRNESRFETRNEHAIVMRQGAYAYDTPYVGLIPLRRHFFPVIGNLKPKGEEFECAEFIANNLEGVAWWVRNVDRKPSSFSLQTSSDRFYPDFLIGLESGGIVAVEYKGSHIAHGRDSTEKKQIGGLWERRGRNCAFAWVENRNWSAIRDAVARCTNG